MNYERRNTELREGEAQLRYERRNRCNPKLKGRQQASQCDERDELCACLEDGT